MAAILFGVVGLIISGGFIEDIFVRLQEATIHSQLGHLQVYKTGYSKFGRRSPYDYLIDEPEAIAYQLEALPQVSEILLRVEFTGLGNTGRADLPIVGEGVEPDKEARLGTFLTIIAGRQLTDEDTLGVLVGEGVARALRLNPSDYLTLLVNTTDGALNSLEFEVVGIFRTFSKDYDDRAVRIPLGAAQELLVSAGVHSLVFSLDATEATERVRSRVKQALPPDEFEVFTWFELADFYKQTVELYRRQFGVLQLIILVMVLLSVANSVNMAIYERTGEFGTLMALGDRRRGIFKLILVENGMLGLIGAAVGVGLGVLLAMGISLVGIPMPPPPNSSSGYIAFVRIVPDVLIKAFLVGAVATALAAVLPAHRASRLSVVDALRQNI